MMLEPLSDVFEIWNNDLQIDYVPGACMTVDEQLIKLRRC